MPGTISAREDSSADEEMADAEPNANGSAHSAAAGGDGDHDTTMRSADEEGEEEEEENESDGAGAVPNSESHVGDEDYEETQRIRIVCLDLAPESAITPLCDF